MGGVITNGNVKFNESKSSKHSVAKFVLDLYFVVEAVMTMFLLDRKCSNTLRQSLIKQMCLVNPMIREVQDNREKRQSWKMSSPNY